MYQFCARLFEELEDEEVVLHVALFVLNSFAKYLSPTESFSEQVNLFYIPSSCSIYIFPYLLTCRGVSMHQLENLLLLERQSTLHLP